MYFSLRRGLKKYLAFYSNLPKGCLYRILLNFIESSLSGVCFFLSFYFVNLVQLSIETSGAIISCYELGTAIGGLVGGKLTDGFDPGKVSSFSLIIEGIAFFMLTQTTNPQALMLILFVIGVSIYCFTTSNTILVLQHYKKNESENLQAINMLYAASNFGFGIAAFIFVILATKKFQTIFLFSGVCLLFFGIHSLFTEKPINNNFNNTKKTATNQKDVENLGVSVSDNRITFLVLSCLFLVGLIIAQRSTIYLIYLNSTFPMLGIMGLSLIFLLNPLLITFFQTPVVKYFEKYNKLKMVGVGAFFMGVGSCLLNFSFTIIFVIISCILYTLGEMIFFSIAQFICYQNSEEMKKGRSFGLFKFVYATSMIIGPSLSGYIYHFSGKHLLWYIDGIFGIFCLTCCSYFNSKLKPLQLS